MQEIRSQTNFPDYKSYSLLPVTRRILLHVEIVTGIIVSVPLQRLEWSTHPVKYVPKMLFFLKYLVIPEQFRSLFPR
jgi:hypothetical protein